MMQRGQRAAHLLKREALRSGAGRKSKRDVAKTVVLIVLRRGARHQQREQSEVHRGPALRFKSEFVVDFAPTSD